MEIFSQDTDWIIDNKSATIVVVGKLISINSPLKFFTPIDP